MSTVYLETTVIGNIAGRLHPDAAVSARQQLTRAWWVSAAERYRLFISQLTLDECAEGDPEAARERLELLQDVDMVSTPKEAEELAALLVARRAVPVSQPRDALHIAIATVHRVQFIVTWNFKHILNPHVHTKIAAACREGGFEPPVICTPQELLEAEDDS
jgi:hypothetical protein